MCDVSLQMLNEENPLYKKKEKKKQCVMGPCSACSQQLECVFMLRNRPRPCSYMIFWDFLLPSINNSSTGALFKWLQTIFVLSSTLNCTFALARHFNMYNFSKTTIWIKCKMMMKYKISFLLLSRQVQTATEDVSKNDNIFMWNCSVSNILCDPGLRTSVSYRVFMAATHLE